MGLNYYISLSGLMTGQQFINVAQMNIANMNTEGYARQQLSVKANYPAGGGKIENKIGAGVWTLDVNRVKDDMLIQQARNQKGFVGFYDQKTRFLSDIESIYNENGEGTVSGLMNDFFNEWEEAAKYPESLPNRIALIGKGEKIASRISNISEQFQILKGELDQKIKFDVGELNNTLKQIADVNWTIKQMGTNVPNSLLDERDKYLDDLSQMMDITVTHDDAISPEVVTVKMGGVVVVSDKIANDVNGFFDPLQQKWTLVSNNIVLSPTSGSLKGEIDARNNDIKKYEADFDTMVKTLITEVNNLVTTGFGLDGTTGQPFFTGTDASSMDMNALLAKNPEKIGLSNAFGTPGNGDIARSVAALRDAQTMAGGTASMITYYNGYTVNIASNLHEAVSNLTINENVRTDIESQKQRIQGVNMDEELANLMQFEHFYNANAKALQSVDKAFQTVLELI